MFFGINGAEAILILVIAIAVIGPERMPQYARQLRKWAEQARDWVTQGKETVKAELGDDIDLAQLDPRQYDPRRIVREAMAQPAKPATSRGAAAAAAAAAAAKRPEPSPDAAHYDDEAT